MDRDWTLKTIRTPVGRLWLAARGAKLFGVELEPRFESQQRRLARAGLKVDLGAQLRPRASVLMNAADAVKRYFSGDLAALASVQLALEGPDSWMKVWRAVRRIKPGKVVTYAKLASSAGMERAFRATGAANGANPLALFVPCHRVVASSGRLQGYGGGLAAKSWLLAHEGVENDGEKICQSASGLALQQRR